MFVWKFRQGNLCNDVSWGQQYRSFHEVLQFTDVPRPRMGHQGFHRLVGKGFDFYIVPFTKTLNEIFSKEGNIFFTLPQGRNMDRKDIQSVIQIDPEPAS